MKEQRNGRLEEAMTNLLHSQTILAQAQALLVQNHATFQAEKAETDRINSERFARIEALLMEHSRILAEHTRILEALPDAVRQKFGFQPPQPLPAER